MTGLSGQCAVVTGASRGIGRAVAETLRRAGASVVRAARSLNPGRGDGLLDVRCDLTRPDDVEALAAATRAAFGPSPPDLVVSAAGTFFLKPLTETRPEDFATQLGAGLQGAFHVARAFLPPMRDRGRGRLITIGSIADHRAFPENAAYCAAKFGLRGLHEALREEYSGSGLLCTLISPGPTDTAAWDAVDPDRRPGFLPRSAMLRPEDVADAVLWVATRPPNVDIDWIRLGPAGSPIDR